MSTLKFEIRLPIDPRGPDWVFAYFFKNIIDDLFKKKLMKHGFEPESNIGCQYIRSGPFKKWRKTGRGTVLLLDMVSVAQENNFPVVVEENVPYLVLDEKTAMIEFMKYSGCHN